MRRRTWIVPLLAAAAAWPAAAQAETYCVAPSGCTHTTVAAAVGAANATAGVADRIEIRAGTHAVPATLTHAPAGGALEIVGAGVDATTLVATTGAGSYVLRLASSGSVSDLTVELPAGDSRFGVEATGGQVARLAVAGAAALTGSTGLYLRSGADAKDVEVEVGPAPFANYGIQVDDADDSRLIDVDVRGGYGIHVMGSGGGATTVIHGARVTARTVGLTARNASVDVDGLLAEVTGASGDAVSLGGIASETSRVTLRHATLRAPGTGTGIAMRPSTAGDTAIATVRDTVVVGTLRHVLMHGNADTTGKLDTAWSTIQRGFVEEPSAGDTEVVMGPGNVATLDPRVAATGDATPAAGSPLIDAGEPGEAVFPANVLDVLGAPRVRDGDGDGVARRDIGAVEAGPPPSPPPPPPPAPDPPAGGGTTNGPGTTPRPPAVKLPGLTVPRTGLRLDTRGRVALKLTCPKGGATCAGTVTVKSVKAITAQRARKRVVTLGALDYTIAAGATKTVRVRVSRTMRAYLRRRGALKVAAHLAAAGARPTVVPFTLRKAARRR